MATTALKSLAEILTGDKVIPEGYLSAEQLAKKYGISATTVRRRLADADVPFVTRTHPSGNTMTRYYKDTQ